MSEFPELGVWGDAVCAAMVSKDRRELVELLRHHNKPTNDVLEFIAWLLEERTNGRPPLPSKFKGLHNMARNPALWDAVMDLRIQRAVWHDTHRGKFPYKERLAATAKRWEVDESALQVKDRRSRHRV